MKSVHGALIAVLLAATPTAHAAGGGSFYKDKVAMPMVSAYAYAVPDYFDKSKTAVAIFMRDRPMDTAAYDAAPDRAKAFGDLIGNMQGTGASLRFVIGTDKSGHAVVEGVDTGYRGTGGYRSSSMAPGTDSYALDLKVNDGKRIEGTLRRTQDSEKTEDHGTWFDLHFALDVASGPPSGGRPGPNGGPLAGFKNYASALSHAAFRVDQESLDGFANTITDARLEAFNQVSRKAKGDAWEGKVKAELHRMEAEIPDAYEFDSGRVNGNVATITIHGKPHDAEASAPTPLLVTMKKEHDVWVFEKVQTAPAPKTSAAAPSRGKTK